MLSNMSMQQKLLRLFPAFPCLYWLLLLQHRGSWIRILIHRQLLKTLGYFMIACSTNLSSTSWSQLYFILMWSSPFYSLKSSFNNILLYLTSFSNPSTISYTALCYKKTQFSWVVMGREMKAIFQVITQQELKYLGKILKLNSLRSQCAKLNSGAMNSKLFVLPRKNTAEFKNVFFRIKSFSCSYKKM